MNQTLSRAVSIGLLLALTFGSAELLAQDAAGQQMPSGENSSQAAVELPDSPGTVSAAAQQTQTTSPPSRQSSGSTNQQSSQTTQPSGTAVAPGVQVSGGAASKPAGAAIAPPKQRQVRSWLIKFGFIAGAGAALGTVAALSAASPGHVPGSGH